jgi:hypothetical protein
MQRRYAGREKQGKGRLERAEGRERLERREVRGPMRRGRTGLGEMRGVGARKNERVDRRGPKEGRGETGERESGPRRDGRERRHAKQEGWMGGGARRG